MDKHASAMRPKIANQSHRAASVALHLCGQAIMGVALGLSFCLAAALIDPSGITSLIAHDAAPQTTALILISFFALMFGAGAALTGMVLTDFKKH
jgi:hypothetical protein